MNEASINLLARWAVNRGVHMFDDPDLESLYVLDDLREKVYTENRITAPGGFTEASILAFEAVVRKVIEMENQKEQCHK